MGQGVKAAAAAVATASRGDNPDPERIEDARRHLATAKVEQYVEAVLADAPPLSEDQKARLAGLFGGER